MTMKRRIGRRPGVAGAWLAVFIGCASAPPGRVGPRFEDGIRQTPLTPREAEGRLRGTVSEVEVCYQREVLNLIEGMSNYVFEVSIPTDASKPTIKILEETVPGQIDLRTCLIETFGRVRFPAHVGPPITLRVPVEGPG